MVYGYARVSTLKQMEQGNSLEAQVKALKEAGAEIIYKDAFTGKKLERPEFSKMIEELEKGDTLVVTKLDRLGRSISSTSELITSLIDKGVTVNILNFGVLTNDSLNTFMRNLLLAFAEFERSLIIERTSEGRAIARQNPDYKEGRKQKYNSEKIKFAIHLLENHSYKETEVLTGISRSTLYRYKIKQAIGR